MAVYQEEMGCYLIISNVYRINVYADIRLYGLLKTVGTSGQQLKRLVRWIATYHSIPGIALGIVSGVLVGSILLPSVMGVMIFSDTSRSLLHNKILIR